MTESWQVVLERRAYLRGWLACNKMWRENRLPDNRERKKIEAGLTRLELLQPCVRCGGRGKYMPSMPEYTMVMADRVDEYLLSCPDCGGTGVVMRPPLLVYRVDLYGVVGFYCARSRGHARYLAARMALDSGYGKSIGDNFKAITHCIRAPGLDQEANERAVEGPIATDLSAVLHNKLMPQTTT